MPGIQPGIWVGKDAWGLSGRGGLAVRLVVPHVFHGAMVTLLEPVTEIAAGFIAFDGGMFVHPVVVSIGMTMLVEVAAGCFHSFMETLALCIAIAVRFAIPIVIAIVILISCGREWLRFVSAGPDRGRCSNAEGKSGNCEQRYFHKIGILQLKLINVQRIEMRGGWLALPWGGCPLCVEIAGKSEVIG
jgi:hypothetical protein